MKIFRKAAAMLLTVIFLTSCAAAGGKPTSGEKDKASLQIDAKNLNKTIVTSHMEEKIGGGKNLLYCSTFQLAWNELSENIIKGKINLQGNPQMAQILNKKSVDKKSLSEESYLAMSGYGKDKIIDKINQALKNKFGDNAWKVEEELSPEAIISYAFLYKALAFEKPFEKVKEPFDFGGTKVKAFGLVTKAEDSEEVAKQVEIFDYKNKDDFIIRIASKSQKDEIIFAKVKPGENLSKTYTSVQNRMKSSDPEKMKESNKLIIPQFNFDITRNYEELEGKGVLNKGFEDYIITKAVQRTKFTLDEKGVELKSEAKIVLTKSVVIESKNLIFDKPFMIILKEKGSDKPYFILWVDNAELMVK